MARLVVLLIQEACLCGGVSCPLMQRSCKVQKEYMTLQGTMREIMAVSSAFSTVCVTFRDVDVQIPPR